MKISFFVEFPEEELDKLSLVDFPIKLYIAARSLEEFRELEKKILEMNPYVEAAYWPILEKSYWVSPFSFNRELDSLHEDLSKNVDELEVLLDLELPTFWLRLILYNLPSIIFNAVKYRLGLRNPRIRSLFHNQDEYKIRITTTAYPATSKYHIINYAIFKILGFIGLYYNPKAYNHKVIYMCYSSIRKDILEKTLKNLKTLGLESMSYYQVGLGLLDFGMLSRTGFIQKLQRVGLLRSFKLLSPDMLGGELVQVEELGIEDVTIYSLGGLNPDNIKVLQNHVTVGERPITREKRLP